LARAIPLRTACWMLSADVPTTSVTLYVASLTIDLVPRYVANLLKSKSAPSASSLIHIGARQ
jgi:hypothetical protein